MSDLNLFERLTFLGALMLSVTFNATASTICGRDANGYVLEKVHGDYPLVNLVREQKPTICRQDDRYYIFMQPPYMRLLYVENPIIPFEVFQDLPLPRQSRVNYINAMHERTKTVVQAALKSGLIRDREILGILNQMLNELLSNQPSVAVDSGEESSFCRGQSYFGYVEPSRRPFMAHLCRRGYESESPHTFIHEYTHIVQFNRRPVDGGKAAECQADLVAMMATGAAFKSGKIPETWHIQGSYYHGCPATIARFEKFFYNTGPTSTMTKAGPIDGQSGQIMRVKELVYLMEQPNSDCLSEVTFEKSSACRFARSASVGSELQIFEAGKPFSKVRNPRGDIGWVPTSSIEAN